jgi:4-amino-4-deoxy-L-arabinose transferase-like glycosyltransferase
MPVNWLRSGAAANRFPPSLWCALLLIVGGLAIFSQTWAWWGDEGFHLLASQLINAGKKPYLDFFYPQPPVYAYLNAGWMRIFGQNWGSSHMLSALLTGGSVILSAGYVFERVPENSWKLSAAVVAAILIGLNTTVIGFATISQAYSICLFLTVAAFRLGIKGVAESRPALLLWSGLCAGASVESSLLSAPIMPIVLAWTAWHSAAGRRVKACSWFLVGAGLSLLPLVWLAVLAPRQMLFNIFEYHFFYRSPSKWIALDINFNTLSGLLHSRQFLLLVVFAGIGLLFVGERSQRDASRKAEFYLCGWLAAGFALFLGTLWVTQQQYFVLLIPFLSILASVGIMATASWLRQPGRPAWLVPGILVLFVAGLPWWLWQQRQRLHWPRLEAAARAVNEVTPQGGLIWAYEGIYFAAQRIPPSGLEHADAQKLQLSPVEAASLHVVSRASLHEWIASGRFATVASCWANEDWIDSNDLRRIYAKHAMVDSCDIFWSINFSQAPADSVQ